MSRRPAAPASPARRRSLLGLPAFGLAACSVLDNPAPRFDFYVIEDLRAGTGPGPADATAALPRIDRTLLITTGPTPALYDSDRIVYTRDGAGRAYYQFSNWAERPLRRIVVLAEQRLADAGRFRTVAQTLSGVRGDLLLSLRLDELLHDDTVSPGTMRVGIAADLLDWRTRAMLGRRTFVRQAPVSTRDAPGAARAASVAVSDALDALSAWVAAVAAASVPDPASTRAPGSRAPD